MSLYEAAFELKDYCIWFTFTIRTEDMQVPKLVWFGSCKHFYERNCRQEQIWDNGSNMRSTTSPPNKLKEISVGRTLYDSKTSESFFILI